MSAERDTYLDPFDFANDRVSAAEYPVHPYHVRKLRDLSAALGVPIRYERAPVTVDPLTGVEIDKRGTSIWLVTCAERVRKSRVATAVSPPGAKVNKEIQGPRRATKRKVRLKEGVWNCSCPGFKKHADCRHVKIVKFAEGFDKSVFELERRRPPTQLFFPPGTPTQTTRENHARNDMPWRLPQLVQAFIKALDPPARQAGAKGGPIGTDFSVTLYILTSKCTQDLNHDDLRAWLEVDRKIWGLGHFGDRAPCENTFSTVFKAPELEGMFYVLIANSAALGSETDTRILGDSFAMAGMLRQISRDMKAGMRRPSYRSDREMLKYHFGSGDITGLIYSIRITNDWGVGSADNPQLPELVEMAQDANPNFVSAIYDPAYPGFRNYRELDRLGVRLFTRERQNEDRLNGKNWPTMAREMAEMEQFHKVEYHEEIRRRPKAEEVCSRMQRRKRHSRLRRRRDDAFAELPKEYNPKVQLTHHPEEVIRAVLRTATVNVGAARLNEALADVFGTNLRKLVMLEKYFGMQIDFENPNFKFPKMVTLKEEDFLANHPLPSDVPQLGVALKPNNATGAVQKPNNVIQMRVKRNNPSW